MLDIELQRKLIITFVLAAILTIIITIVVLVFIWIPEEVEVEPQFEIGKVEVESSSEESVIEKYYKQLYVMFINDDLDTICNLVGKDYLDYYKYDKQDIIDMLREKNVMVKGLELVQYKSFMIPGYSNVYELDLKVKDQAYAINIVIREISPNNYTIAFDKFIDYTKDCYSQTTNSVKLDISERVRYTNSVQYEFKLTNGYNKNVKINSGATTNPIILVNTQDEVRRPILTTITAAEVTMTSGEFRNFTAVFPIEDVYEHVTYNRLVFKNIGYDGINGTENLEFVLN